MNSILAAAEGMSAEVQGQKWLQLWTQVCEKVKATNGKCFVMAKGTGPRVSQSGLVVLMIITS